MGFPEARARAQVAVFARLGEPGYWNGADAAVQVRLVEAEDMASIGETQLIVGSMAIRVRKAEVECPRTGDQCWLEKSERMFRVTSDPMLDRNAAWTCPVVEVL